MKPCCFEATIYKTGINFAVDVPPEVSLAFKRRGNIPINGTINGLPFKATFVPIGEGRHRLYLNGESRKALDVGEGDAVKISAELDRKPRTRPMPPEFREALDANKEAKEAWARLSPSRQKEILSYLGHLKSPEALKRNVDKAIKNHLLFYGRKK